MSLLNFEPAPHLVSFWKEKGEKLKRELKGRDSFDWFVDFRPNGYAHAVRDQKTGRSCRVFSCMAMADAHMALFHKQPTYQTAYDPESVDKFRVGQAPRCPDQKEISGFIATELLQMNATQYRLWDRPVDDMQHYVKEPEISILFLKKQLLRMGPMTVSVVIDNNWRVHPRTGNVEVVAPNTAVYKEKPPLHSVLLTGWREGATGTEFQIRDHRGEQWGRDGDAYAASDREVGRFEIAVLEKTPQPPFLQRMFPSPDKATSSSQS